MAKPKSLTVTVAQLVALPNFENTRIEISAEVEMEEGDDFKKEFKKLNEKVTALLTSEVESIREEVRRAEKKKK